MDCRIEPNRTIIERVEKSAHFLNEPKHMFNDVLDSIYRQFINEEGIHATIQHVRNYLSSRLIHKPLDNAKLFVMWRNSITMQEFNKINTNSYVDNTPERMLKELDKQCAYVENNKTYYWNGGVNYIPSYPYKYKTL